MKRFLLLACIALFTLPVFAEKTILIVGDSISAGYGIDLNKRYAVLLQTYLTEQGYPYRVINASISGDTTSDGLQRLPKLLQQYHPQITVIELGGNDGLRGLQLAVIQQNLAKMITLVKAAKSKVIVLGVRLPPNYGEIYTQQFQQIYKNLTSDKQIHVIPQFLSGVDDDPKYMQADGIHPTEAAQVILMKQLWSVLINLINK